MRRRRRDGRRSRSGDGLVGFVVGFRACIVRVVMGFVGWVKNIPADAGEVGFPVDAQGYVFAKRLEVRVETGFGRVTSNDYEDVPRDGRW